MGEMHFQNKNCVVAVVYGSTDRRDRKELWRELERCQAGVGDRPWVIGGDFNIVRSVLESQGGGTPDLNVVDEFNECIRSIEVVDHPYFGNHFTWSRNWRERGIVRVLDRVMCNYKWLDYFRRCRVHIPTSCDSDIVPWILMLRMRLYRGPSVMPRPGSPGRYVIRFDGLTSQTTTALSNTFCPHSRAH
ncbi:hypothetical protein LIER_36687 [Lithospermum erythrorhizon]|uniref:Endonuclease/exonuclease/phosphatase domain-containing protein n=1 Tax=Lithospermum erythrorhizon TaxID=34254 RepID=A0AAV3PDP4_LITER